MPLSHGPCFDAKPNIQSAMHIAHNVQLQPAATAELRSAIKKPNAHGDERIMVVQATDWNPSKAKRVTRISRPEQRHLLAALAEPFALKPRWQPSCLVLLLPCAQAAGLVPHFVPRPTSSQRPTRTNTPSLQLENGILQVERPLALGLSVTWCNGRISERTLAGHPLRKPSSRCHGRYVWGAVLIPNGQEEQASKRK